MLPAHRPDRGDAGTTPKFPSFRCRRFCQRWTQFIGRPERKGFNPKMASFDATDDLNLYASVAKGFRVGGVNGNISETLCGDELDRVGLDPGHCDLYR